MLRFAVYDWDSGEVTDNTKGQDNLGTMECSLAEIVKQSGKRVRTQDAVNLQFNGFVFHDPLYQKRAGFYTAFIIKSIELIESHFTNMISPTSDRLDSTATEIH